MILLLCNNQSGRTVKKIKVERDYFIRSPTLEIIPIIGKIHDSDNIRFFLGHLVAGAWMVATWIFVMMWHSLLAIFGVVLGTVMTIQEWWSWHLSSQHHHDDDDANSNNCSSIPWGCSNLTCMSLKKCFTTTSEVCSGTIILSFSLSLSCPPVDGSFTCRAERVLLHQHHVLWSIGIVLQLWSTRDL